MRIIILGILTLIIISGCSNSNEFPETQIISEEPLIIGYITEIDKDKQVFQVVENISKEEAVNGEPKENGYWVQMHISTIDEKIDIGDKVAIWDSPSNNVTNKDERKAMPIARYIVLLER